MPRCWKYECTILCNFCGRIMSGFEVIEGGPGGEGEGGGGSRSLHPRRREQTNKAGLKKKK